jgi:hypothetical protein
MRGWGTAVIAAPCAIIAAGGKPNRHELEEAAHTFKRREATVEDKLKIAKVSLAEGKSRKLLSLRLELGLARQVTSEKVL